MGSPKRRWKAVLLFEISLLSLLLFTACSKSDEAQQSQDKAGVNTASTAPTTETQPEVFAVVKNRNFTQQPLKAGYVSAICLNVREGSSTGSRVIGHLFKGDPLEVYEVQGGWFRVNDAAGYVDGWVSSKYISDTPVESDFTIPDDYKGRKTPTINESVTAKYVGVKACIPCHNKPHAGFTLGPYGVWRDHFHGAAFATLSTAYSKAIAQRRGVGDPTVDWRCVKCHVTALGVPADRKGPSYSDNDGVGCEACHGPGGDYLHKHYGSNRDPQTLSTMGFRKFSDLSERDNMCRACHNELSPTYKPFNVEAFSDAIRHWASEYVIEVPDDAPTEIVIKDPEPVKAPTIDVIAKVAEEKKLYDQTDYFKKLVTEEEKQPEPKPTGRTPTPQAPKPETPTGSSTQSNGSARLAGIPKDWMLSLNGPKRGPVFFPHELHLAGAVTVEREAEACVVCHHTSQAGAAMTNCSDGACHKFEPTAAPSREKAFHANCRSCHREEDAGPQKCRECHNG